MITETEHLAGNTLRLTITLPDSVENYNSVFISLYTNQNKQFRFSVAAKNDYYLAYVGDAANKIKVVLTGAMTEKMSGKLMFEVKTINNIEINFSNNTIHLFLYLRKRPSLITPFIFRMLVFIWNFNLVLSLK